MLTKMIHKYTTVYSQLLCFRCQQFGQLSNDDSRTEQERKCDIAKRIQIKRRRRRRSLITEKEETVVTDGERQSQRQKASKIEIRRFPNCWENKTRGCKKLSHRENAIKSAIENVA